MSAQDPVEVRLETLTDDWVERVVAVEQTAYSHPWSRGNFADALASGYQAQLLLAGDTLLGYFVAMKGVDEVHLLNITVAPAFQRQGWARVLLDALTLWARGQQSDWVWLEVRASNARAQTVYAAHGFRRVGERRAYYPGVNGREDALVMCLNLRAEFGRDA
jgi:ribosomal-protein-alanine N-acetyltransferase